ncbi:MAG: SRPBCC family protein [Pricia sp.]
MNATNKSITVKTDVKAPVAKVWELWTVPEHIKNGNKASDDWQTTHAENDLRAGGKFTSRMEAKDGSMGFDFGGTYDEVDAMKLISYTLDDGRKVEITFATEGDTTKITETFEAENTNSIAMQQGGWQAILNSFKKYAESQR